MKKNSKVNRGPGRPKYIPVIPHGKFTFTDLKIANNINLKTGKGKECTTLTLRKWLKRELSNHHSGAITLLKDVFAAPNSKSGLGRKQYVYQKRVGVTSPKAAADVMVNVSTPALVDAVSQTTMDYEAKKAALLAPTPAVTITPGPTPEPIAEIAPKAVPAKAPVAKTAPTAEPVTA